MCSCATPRAAPGSLSFYAYFPVGYMSWMNQSAQYRPDLGRHRRHVCDAVPEGGRTISRSRSLKDKTFFLAEQPATAWEARQEAFEGEGGLHQPAGVQQDELAKGDALYETPAAIIQYRVPSRRPKPRLPLPLWPGLRRRGNNRPA